MTNMFDSFRIRQGVEKSVTDKNAVKFIYEGSMATEINVGENHYAVGLVYENKEEEDLAYLYIAKPETFQVGTVFTWVDTNLAEHHYIIYDEQKQVKNTRYNKYLCFECNVEVDKEWGYLTGPRTTYVNTQLRQSLYEVSLAKPVLVMGQDEYPIASVLSIAERNWRIIEKDNYSAPGLVYYYLEQYVGRKDSDNVAFDMADDEQEADEWRPGEKVTVPTEDGYFTASIDVNPVITPDYVYFTVPYTATEITIAFKTEGEIVERTYKVVM